MEEKHTACVLEAFDTLFSTRDDVAAERYWSPNAIQRSARIAPGRDGLGGSMTLTGGIMGHRPQPQWVLPASVITALEGLTRSRAVELAPLRVNIVASGLTKTPRWGIDYHPKQFAA